MTVDIFGDCTSGGQGSPGEKGDRGETGPGGKRGADGPAGIDGPAGKRGRQGPEGPPGAKGLKGDPGPSGSHGEKGDHGLAGLKGDKGDDGERGIQGVKGEPGDPLGTMLRWMPSLLLDGFRRSSEFCYYLKKMTDFKWTSIASKKTTTIVGFESQSDNNRSADMETGLIKPQTLSDGGYCAELSRSMLRIMGVTIASRHRISILVITFKPLEVPVKSQCLIKNGNRSITIKGNNIQIWTKSDGKPFEVNYNVKEWNTFYVQWSYTDTCKGFVYYRKYHSEVIWKKQDAFVEDDVLIGDTGDESSFFVGCIAAMELYTLVDPEIPELPEIIRKKVIEWHHNCVA